MIYRIIIFSFGVACIIGAPTDIASSDKQQPTVIPIVSQSEELELNGTYKFSYETGNGIKREETSYDKVLPKTSGRSHSSEEGEESDESDESNEIHVQQGSYSYTAPDGTLITVRYIADENGFRPVGSHLPRVPTAISPISNEKSGRILKQPDSASSESVQLVNVKSTSEELESTVASPTAVQAKPADKKQIEATSDLTSTDKKKISSSAKTLNLVTTKASESEPKAESTESTIITSTQANGILESASDSGSTPEASEKSEDISKKPNSASSGSVPPVDVNSASEKTVSVATSRSAAETKPADDKPSENTSVATPKGEEPNTTETTSSSGKTLDIVTTKAYQSEPKTEATESTITSTHTNEILESDSGSGSTSEGKTDGSEEKMETSTQAATDEQSIITTDTTESPPDATNEKTTEFSNAETTSPTTLSDGINTEADIITTTVTSNNEETTRPDNAEAVTQEAVELSSSKAPSSEEVSTSSSST